MADQINWFKASASFAPPETEFNKSCGKLSRQFTFSPSLFAKTVRNWIPRQNLRWTPRMVFEICNYVLSSKSDETSLRLCVRTEPDGPPPTIPPDIHKNRERKLTSRMCSDWFSLSNFLSVVLITPETGDWKYDDSKKLGMRTVASDNLNELHS